MTDPAATALVGKAQRVLGVFVLMIGAGTVLDSRAVALGGVVALAGVALFVWGLIEARPRSVERAPLDTPAPMDQPTETPP